MNESELSEIEVAIGFCLPDEYRRVAIDFPFRPMGRDCVYWFFNRPSQVIQGTMSPLVDGGYDMAGWQPGFLTIGESAAGDLFVLDTASPTLPVLCLSHESHNFNEEYSTFRSFVDEWTISSAAMDARMSTETAANMADVQKRIWMAALFVLCAIPAALLLAVIVSSIALWIKG